MTDPTPKSLQQFRIAAAGEFRPPIAAVAKGLADLERAIGIVHVDLQSPFPADPKQLDEYRKASLNTMGHFLEAVAEARTMLDGFVRMLADIESGKL